MERHVHNALALARFLEAQPAVARVYYPDLESSPFRQRTRHLLPQGAGALLSFELKSGLPAVERLLSRLRLIRLMASLGHVATTLSHPASTSHRGLSAEDRRRAGITDGLVRCSVGLERIDDLTADLDQALGGSG
jgi:O-acetylhomoserine/O-acetylserine sulfhydrylase-like pyridoxal-dependent enzyme